MSGPTGGWADLTGAGGDIWLGELESNNRLLGDLDELRWSNSVLTEFHLNSSIPEPSSFALMLSGVAILCVRRKRSCTIS